MKEIRKIQMFDVQRQCIANHWYTCGDCTAYDNMLTFVNDLEYASIDDLETIATDIKKHSDTDDDIACIMTVLANKCCVTFFK